MKKSLIGAVVGMLVLGACGTPAYLAADVTFTQDMIPHHEQALDMAKLVPSRSTNEKVRGLAERIEKAQDPEITQMKNRIEEWDAHNTDHGGHHMAGMMSDDDMTKLETAGGAEFDRLWLDMMVKHHEGAIEMARTELKDGNDPDTKTLAQAIIDGQQREITEMKDLLRNI